MSLIPIVLLAAAAFALAVLVLRLPRPGWTLLGAALVFALAGYAWQGRPGLAGSPTRAAAMPAQEGEALVAARRSLYSANMPSHFVTVADGFARRGRFLEAAGILRGVVEAEPRNSEAWLALAIALTEHAGGQLTPAALSAFGRAQATAPANPGPTLFLGTALVRDGEFGQARALWAELLARAPADAPWRPVLQERVDRLDAVIAQSASR